MLETFAPAFHFMSSELRPTTGAITGHALSNVFGSPFGLSNELLGVEVGLVGGLQTLGTDRVDLHFVDRLVRNQRICQIIMLFAEGIAGWR